MNLPNKLTMVRIFILPLIIVVSLIKPLALMYIGNYDITVQNLIILILFALASFTDFLDGNIARKRNLVTDFGKFMDPLADKLLVLTALVILLEQGRFQVFNFGLGFVVIIILAREFMVTGIRLLAMSSNKVIAASKLGKAKTVSQMVMVIVLLAGVIPFEKGSLGIDIVKTIFISLAFLLTVISGIDYFVKNKDLILSDK